MKTEKPLPLENITFGLYDREHREPDPKITPLYEAIRYNEGLLCRHVKKLGGAVVSSSIAGKTDYRLNALPNGKTLVRESLAEIPNLARVPEQSFGSMDEDAVELLKQEIDSGRPVMFAYQKRDRGHAKYLIDNSQQVAVMQNLGEAYREQTGQQLYDHFMVRQFVETPSDFFTSYRLVVTAAGEVQAAGLLYSGHTKASGRRMIRTCDDTGDERLRFMTRHFEDPNSPYFLDAIDARSNIMCGGDMIPLMGNNRQPLREGEANILEAHGIEPVKPEVPQTLVTYARQIGSVARRAELVVGVDFIQDKDNNPYLLEVNLGPTGRAYNICHLGGQASMTDAMYHARVEAIDQIAAARSA